MTPSRCITDQIAAQGSQSKLSYSVQVQRYGRACDAEWRFALDRIQGTQFTISK